MSPAAFTPTLRPKDAIGRFWLEQVTLRLRREVTWLRHLHSNILGLPSDVWLDRAQEGLDLARYWDAKQEFIKDDATARYLSTQLEGAEPERTRHRKGSFGWVSQTLELNDAAQFVLALGLAVSYDNAFGPVVAFCLGDASTVQPTLGLAQRLWDEPDAILLVASPGSDLFSHGLLQYADHRVSAGDVDWDRSFSCPSPVARLLLVPGDPPPDGLVPVERNGAALEEITNGKVVKDRLRREAPRRLRVVPVVGPSGSDYAGTAAELSRPGGRILSLQLDLRLLGDATTVNAMLTCCWLLDVDLFLELEASRRLLGQGKEAGTIPLLSFGLPISILAAAESITDLAGVPPGRLLPAVGTASLGYAERLELWKHGLGKADAARLSEPLAHIARQFRFERATVKALTRQLKLLGRKLKADDLADACRAELKLHLGDLAEELVPRFEPEELILPHAQAQQLLEIRNAMSAVAEVHHRWGTAKAWNSAGISAMFHGPPGTGKSMAAETLATALDLPLYRIDLSEVVNKYIGETEKNLRRLFDAVSLADAVLFFDDAEMLFAPRTQVKDSHDRYANLEVGYLLGRMEAAKGLVILATNRRQDLDEAFVRRLRHIVAFTVPGPKERRRIWDVVIPASVGRDKLDLDYLAESFELTGGQIRSAVFAASLQTANRRPGHKPVLDLDTVMVAIKREFEKSGRTAPPERFGPHADVIRALEKAPA